ncbi:MAG TPA: hypothetical protein DCR78_06705 [Pseudomonas sp.]|uniref:hypothetical protein n=1 Tax=Stutzerimonas xanthomarina TaxID=271420 RepID=UPI000E822A3F|nr:hypothetical protein [Stutzerimonas xanthomarina]MBU0812890.1 hypothetical protein [Gammaproteobacteria bacterium]HAQ86114.1 hypothetical protein [Pseudomonas sp.]MBK3847322.1 hypothetical protein [Stutzerimonas xanthomarina]MBU0851615.1 hypothetical protein [Gammaproteobacteria bacterium]MBU1302604.1 hypothetical protein [Gammaproteobacteria bacterium]|tara:strand:- start:3403 stop:4722 length:1320 start_codon:yes stop_codon:yes gene_type:complete
MNPSSLTISHRRSRPLAIDKPTVLTLIAASLLISETFAGALRYYLDIAGVSALLYLPKLACIAAVALEIPRARSQPGVWLVLFAVLVSSMFALLHGATLGNVGFSLFIYIPLLFGLFCGGYLEQRTSLLSWVIGFCLVASMLGIALDMFTSVPWKGYSYMMGDVELTANKSWAFGSTDRLAGFARMSTNLAVMIALYSLFLAAFLRSRLLRMLLYPLAFGAIFLTTNKSTAAAYLLTLLMLFLAGYRLPSATAFFIAVLVGMGLPIASLLLNIPQSEAYSASLLASFNDRLIHSWPNFIDVIVNEGWGWWGAGFGAVGSSAAAFPLAWLELLSIADNTALYLWGMLGVFGVLLYLLLFPLLLRLHDRGPRIRDALLGIVFCAILIGWATDVLEVTTATLFLGMAIAHALTPQERHHPVATVSTHYGLELDKRKPRDDRP